MGHVEREAREASRDWPVYMYARYARSMEQNGGIRFLWHGVEPCAKSRTMTSQANFRVLNQSLPPFIAYQ